MPSFVTRAAFLPAAATPLVRKIASAFSRSPPLSTSARLQSIIPALVFSRSCFTSCGSISVVVFIEHCRLRRSALDVFLRLRRHASHFDLLANARFVACCNNGIHKLLQNHANSANRVIVAGDRVIDDFQSPNALANGGEISQGATQPALIHIKLTASQCRLFYRFLRLLLTADK